MRLGMGVLLCAVSLAAQNVPGKTSLVPSDELNKNLPSWLRFSGEYRARLEGFSGGAYRSGNDDLYLLNRFRINMRIQPASWLRFQFQGQDARVFGKNQTPAAPPFQDTLDLRAAFVEVGDLEKKAFGLRAGRQELVFGEQRLVGHVSWLNTARTFDAARLTLRAGGYRLDAFAASVVPLRGGEFNRPKTGNNFHGLYGGIEKLVPKAMVEPYLFWRLEGTAGLDAKTTGFRWVGKLPANFDYGAEVAAQTGVLAAESVGAWAGHWLLGYSVPAAKLKPRLIGEYNYASGDRTPGDGKRGTFDQLYPTPHDLYGLADQVGWRNIRHVRAGVELKASPKLTLAPNYHSFWLAQARDGLYAASGAMVARVADGSTGTRVGQEVDFQVKYAMNKTVQIWGGHAHLFPGAFLKKATPGKSYSFPYLMVTYSF